MGWSASDCVVCFTNDGSYCYEYIRNISIRQHGIPTSCQGFSEEKTGFQRKSRVRLALMLSTSWVIMGDPPITGG